MAGFFQLWEGEPDFINELGVKWWKDDSTTEYAQREDRHGISLAMTCFAIEMPDGYKTRVLISHKTNDIVEEDTSMENMAIKIDTRKYLLYDAALQSSRSGAERKPRAAKGDGDKPRRRSPAAPSLKRRD